MNSSQSNREKRGIQRLRLEALKMISGLAIAGSGMAFEHKIQEETKLTTFVEAALVASGLLLAVRASHRIKNITLD